MTPEEEFLGPNPPSCQDFQSIRPPPPARISSVPSVGGVCIFSGITHLYFIMVCWYLTSYVLKYLTFQALKQQRDKLKQYQKKVGDEKLNFHIQ